MEGLTAAAEKYYNWTDAQTAAPDDGKALFGRDAMANYMLVGAQQLGTAALLMMDLDNLKHINDTYGHDWGDQYIRRTGLCLAENTPAGTVVARLSGDEFMLLFYGYLNREQIREKVRILSDAMHKSVAVLPGGSELHISISGGMTWYPEDSLNMETLKKYADFALYQVKHSHKGCLQEFSMESYRREAQTAQLRRDFQ